MSLTEIIIFDACVLYPAPLRDLLMYLALTDLFQAKWTEDIHHEWIRNLLKNRPELTKSQLLRTKKLMNEHIRDCLVYDYEHITHKLTLPDPEDNHVLASAIKCSASIILTYNLKDFPKNHLKKYGIEAMHPDIFIANLLENNQALVCDAIKKLRHRLKNPTMSPSEYLTVLSKQSLIKTIARLEKLMRHI